RLRRTFERTVGLSAIAKAVKPRQRAWSNGQSALAQFIAVCSNAKTCEIGENLLSVSDPILRPQERLIHAGALIRPRTLQRRPVSRLHPYVAMERSAPPVSPVPERGGRSVGELPLSTRV